MLKGTGELQETEALEYGKWLKFGEADGRRKCILG